MWHVKEKADCRLYSGSLSSEAQKILQALRAQRQHVSMVNTRHSQHDRLLGNGQYEGQWEPFCQSQQEGNSQPSVTSPYAQSSQAQTWCLSSQVSSYSSSWDALCYNQTNQRESHDLFSHRGENISFQSSQNQSFPHCDELETDKSFPQTDPCTRPLKSPQCISGKVVAWKSAEEIPIKSPPEGPNEMPFLKGTDNSWGNEVNNSVNDKPNRTPSISQRDSSEKGSDGTTKRIRLNLALEYEKSGLCLANNKMCSKGLECSEVSQVGEDEQVFSTDKRTLESIVDKKQTALTEDRMPLLLPECYHAIKSSNTCATSSSRNILLIDTDGETTEQAIHTMNVEEEKEADGAVPHCSDESEARQCKSINNQDISPKDKKLKMSFINKTSQVTKSVTTQMAYSDPHYGIRGESSNSDAPVKSPGCKGTLPLLKESAPEGDHLFNLKVPCEVHSDAILCSSFTAQSEGFGLLHSTSKQPHPQPLKHTLKRKYEAPHPLTENHNSSKCSSTRCPPKWKPPSSQENKRDNFRKSNSNQTDKVIEEKRTDESKHGSISVNGPNHREVGKCMRSKPGNVTSNLTSDPRVTDASKLSQGDMDSIVKKAQQSAALVLTMVFRDGTTHLDPEQKRSPPACGLLLLIKVSTDTALETLGPMDILLYLKLECAPAWAQHPTPHIHEMFTRDLLLQVFSSSALVVCYKAKDVLRVLSQFYKREFTWKQVQGCQIHDPQLSGWLLDPTDPATCFQDLLYKHCQNPCTTPALGSKKVTQIITGLFSLYRLNMKLCEKLKNQGLWHLYSDMELKMLPVLAAMEVCQIHVDKEALKRTSDLLGTKMKQLEQEAHKAAGQMFLLTSSTQLRTVLFEKLRLHEHCENKKLPKTTNKQQSTSEAALLLLQDIHPLPKIILEYRQIHKIKSTFVDGILSCMMTKNYISSTWHQTSVVTGRVSATHPNFQALPRQPLQVTRKQFIAEKEDEVVTVHPRAMFVPKEGWTFLSADFCQVELRLLAHLSSDLELLRVFTNPEADVFNMLASQWKGVSETEVSSEDREHAKRIVYSVVYGAGLERLSGILGVSTEQARRFQDSFLQTYMQVQKFIQKTVAECQQKGYVLSIMGRRRTLHNINSPDWSVRMQAERQAVNFVVQGSAADLCKMAMIRIFNLLSTSSSVSARLVAQLHDELLYEVEDSQIQQFAAVVKSTMESLEHIDQLNIHLKVPLKVAVSSGKSWGSMSELNV